MLVTFCHILKRTRSQKTYDFKLEVFIWRHVVYVPKSLIIFHRILICVIFRPRDIQEYIFIPPLSVGAILQSPCPSVHSHFCNRYLSFYWKKWFYIWYMALAWWLVPCLPFPGLPHIYFLFTVRLTNERVGVFLARRRVQHLVIFSIALE